MSKRCEKDCCLYDHNPNFDTLSVGLMLMRGLVYDLPKILLLFVKILLVSFVVVLPVNSLIAIVCMVYDFFYLPLVIIESGTYDIPSKIFVCLCIPILLPIFTISSLFVVTLRIIYEALGNHIQFFLK